MPNDYDVRGMLAAKLECWHRMSGADSDALVELVTTYGASQRLAGREQAIEECAQIAEDYEEGSGGHKAIRALAASPQEQT